MSLVDGVCLGDGLGLAVRGSFRVVTENAVLAMPETAIGFFPDVGAGHFLPRLPGAIGMYLGLTGHRLDAADALYTGLATHFIPANRLDAVADALADDVGTPVDTVLERLGQQSPVGDSQLEKVRESLTGRSVPLASPGSGNGCTASTARGQRPRGTLSTPSRRRACASPTPCWRGGRQAAHIV